MTKYEKTGVFVDYDDGKNEERIELKRHDRISYLVERWNYFGEPISNKYIGTVAKENGEFGIYFEDNLSFRFIPFSKMTDAAEDCKYINERA